MPTKPATRPKLAKLVDAPAAQRRFSPLDLALDPENPRLPPAFKNRPEKQIIEVMLDRFAIHEIAESICTAGFVPLDPFVAYDDGKRVVVLEGNRRLATLKLFLDPSLTPERYKNTWAEFRERLKPETKKAIAEISVLVYSSRRNADVLAYIGYRHASGILGWEAEEKAAFIARLLEDKDIGWSYEEIARTIGSKAPHVEKLYVAHRLIEQATELDMAGADRMRSSFGVLTRALQSPGVQEFLGVKFPRDPKKSQNPVTASERDFEDFVRWTFGTDEVKPLLEDSRDLTKWGQILKSPESTQYLRTATDPRFDRAYAKSGGLKQGLVDSLLGAAENLEYAVPLVRQHRGDPEVERAMERCVDYVAQMLVQFPGIAKRQGLKIEDAPPA